MLRYDSEVITGLISQLKSALHLLEEIRQKELFDFQRDSHLISSAKYNLIVAIEAAIDICNHLISKNSYRIPESYSDSFRVLAEHDLLNSDFVEDKLVLMTRFRNRLVHQYWQVDNELLHGILQENLNDFNRFLAEIKSNL